MHVTLGAQAKINFNLSKVLWKGVRGGGVWVMCCFAKPARISSWSTSDTGGVSQDNFSKVLWKG